MAYKKPAPPKNNAKYNAMVAATHAERMGRSEPVECTNTPVTPQIIDDICMRLAEFGEPIEVACPSNWSQVCKYLKKHPEAAEQVELARKRGVYKIAYDMRKVAKGESGYSRNDVNRDKLIIETDFKILKSIAPREFGDKQEIEHSGDLNISLSTRLANVTKILDVTPDE